jgi:hypothetical protein
MRLGAALTGIDTPTLKGLWQSAPYLHDGRAATLKDVFAATGDRTGVTSTLTPAELDQLVRYMLELEDVPETVATDPPIAMPVPLAMMGGSSGQSSASCGLSRPSASPLFGVGAALLLAGSLFCRRRQLA